MRNIFCSCFAFLAISIVCISFASAQADVEFEFDYEINKVYPGLSISPNQLNEANTLIDLNSYYKPNWVASFLSVEITALHNGKSNTVIGKDNVITNDQMKLMQKADVGSDIKVVVHYMPKNNLKNKEAKIEDFTFKIDPTNDASYSLGQDELMKYLAQNALGNIDNNNFEQYKLTAIKFTINEEGEVVDAQVVEKSQKESVDKLLLEAICNMPKWKPASYSNGTKVKQDFVFTVGDHNSCVINLLNIRRC